MKKTDPSEKKGRVLVAEDDAIFLRFVSRVLAMEGYEVLEAGNGLEALKLLDGGGPPVDMIISDVVMPELDGLGLAKEARRRYPGLKIILISGFVNKAEAVLEVLGSGALFLEKPFSVAELMGAVERAC